MIGLWVGGRLDRLRKLLDHAVRRSGLCWPNQGGQSHLGLIPSTLRDGTAWSRLFPTKIQAYEARLDACILVVLKLELIGYY